MFREVVLLEQHPGCTSRMRKEIPFLNQFKCALIRLITLNRTVGIEEEFQSIWHLYSTLNFGLCHFHRKTILSPDEKCFPHRYETQFNF